MLLALQTTADRLDDSTLDAVTLVLLTGFVLSMVTLAILLSRRDPTNLDNDRNPPDRGFPPAAPTVTRPLSDPKPLVPTASSTPAWLTGVTLPQGGAELSEVTAVIERLLRTRRDRRLADGIAVCSPVYRARLAVELGVPESDLAATLSASVIQPEAPVLRAVEAVSASSQRVTVRAGYADRTTEVYVLTRIDGSWVIESIERG